MGVLTSRPLRASTVVCISVHVCKYLPIYYYYYCMCASCIFHITSTGLLDRYVIVYVVRLAHPLASSTDNVLVQDP